MSFLKICSDTPFTIYQCRHVDSGAIFYSRVELNPADMRGKELQLKAVMRSIQQTLKRPVTSRSPIERKKINEFVIDRRFDLSTEGIRREWEFQEINTVPEHLIPVYMNELILGARKNNKVVLNVLEKMICSANLDLLGRIRKLDESSADNTASAQ